jgi:ubiquinone/menaquinone biosynthesis C-methylase UbiE
MNWNVEAYQLKVFQELSLELRGTERVLDIGCGDGHDAAWFAQRSQLTIGLDLVKRPEWRRFACQNLELIEGNAEALPFPDRSFEIVFLKDVLHHASRPNRILVEAQRLCVPGGQICIVEGNRFNPILYIHMTLLLGHQHFSRKVFKRMVQQIFPNARFVHFEAHVYPFHAGSLIGLAKVIEKIVATAPIVRRLSSYNAALVRG